MPVDTAAYRKELRPKLPRWYRGWEHFAFSNLLLGGLAAWLGLRARPIAATDWLAIPAAFLASNFVEYVAHRWPLHKPMGPLRYIYKSHGIQHHRFFTGDAPQNMSTHEPHDFAVVLFGPQSQLALLAGVGLPLSLLVKLLAGRSASLLFGATASAYFLLYEWLHLAYHLPPQHLLARLPGVARLQRHHRAHHELKLMSKYNFNITFPIFDAIFGTTFRESSEPSSKSADATAR